VGERIFVGRVAGSDPEMRQYLHSWRRNDHARQSPTYERRGRHRRCDAGGRCRAAGALDSRLDAAVQPVDDRVMRRAQPGVRCLADWMEAMVQMNWHHYGQAQDDEHPDERGDPGAVAVGHAWHRPEF
jgi:hypothetical protein